MIRKYKQKCFTFIQRCLVLIIFTNARGDLTPRRRRACVVAYLSSANTLWSCCLAEAVNTLVIFYK
ncbi:MAG: hypothetical protein RL342_2409 [Pseudomonadota bacterium]